MSSALNFDLLLCFSTPLKTLLYTHSGALLQSFQIKALPLRITQTPHLARRQTRTTPRKPVDLKVSPSVHNLNMAPDLNSLPPLVAPVPNILPSNTSAILRASQPASPTMSAHPSTAGDESAVGTGPGPVRHPRPLTAAELHSQLEREQEAVVSPAHKHQFNLSE